MSDPRKISESAFQILKPKIKTEVRTLVKWCANKAQERVFLICGKYESPKNETYVDMEELFQELSSKAIDRLKEIVQWRQYTILKPKSDPKKDKNPSRIEEAKQKWVSLNLLEIARNNANNPRFQWSGWWKAKKSARRIGGLTWTL